MRNVIVVPALWGGVVAAVSVGWALGSGRQEERSPPGADGQEPEVEIAIADRVPEATSAKKADNQGSCRNGCSLAKHPIPDLSLSQFRGALEAYAKEPPGEESQALDTLLFYGARTRELLEEHGGGPLPEEHLRFLERELAREDVQVWLRLVTEGGEERVAVGPTRVTLGVKRHLKPEVRRDVQPLEFNGTVMRTGLYHLWSRY